VRWPDGHITETNIPTNAGEIHVAFDGKLRATNQIFIRLP